MRYLGEDGVERHFYSAHLDNKAITVLPWGNDLFDCVVFICNLACLNVVADRLAETVVNANTDYVHVVGPRAEWFHDLVDATSVRIGRQAHVGDGSPMTTWDEEASSLHEMARSASALHGGHDYVFIWVVGSSQDFNKASEVLSVHLKENMESNYNRDYQCPCCDYFSIDEPGTQCNCRVCGWIDDGTAFDRLDTYSDSNGLTLRQARANFRTIGACDAKHLQDVLSPEKRDRFRHVARSHP